ncbi:hypothetical protein [Bacillus thuringiensis]|uniref:hypothetical protein n=1 Tax=Bacillus thuringiensis TaxID=1428 RepID=UPI003F6BDBDF
MKIDIEILQKALRKLYEAVQTIVQWIRQAWEQVKEIVWFYEECKEERKPTRAIYGCVKDKVMRSQVLNRKPARIRARTTC